MHATGEGWWQTRWFAALAILIACVPLAYPPFPPLTDALDHAGRFRVMLDGPESPLAQWYTVTWHPVGNLGSDLIVAVIGPLVGVEAAVKIVALSIVALTVGGCLLLSCVAHGRVSPFALFALPLVYNASFHTGFLNFTLAMALVLHALALWLWMRAGYRRSAVFVGVALILWTTHAYGWAVLCIAVFAVELARRSGLVRAAFACWPLAAPVPLMLLWRSTGGGATFGFLDLPAKALAMLMSFRDTWFVADVLTLTVVVAVIVYGIRRGASARPIAWAAIALLLAFLALPSWLMGSAFADARAAPYVLILALLALRPVEGRQARVVALVGVAFFGARIAATTVSLTLANQAQARELVALDHVPTGARIVQFVSPDCADGWRTSRLEHIGGLAQVRRRAFVNSQWRDVGASLLATHHPAAGPYENDPSQLLRCDGGVGLRRHVAAIPRGAFDLLWLVDIPEGVPATLPGMTQLWRDGDSALYRIDRR